MNPDTRRDLLLLLAALGICAGMGFLTTLGLLRAFSK